jgi:hypothetical protein
MTDRPTITYCTRGTRAGAGRPLYVPKAFEEAGYPVTLAGDGPLTLGPEDVVFVMDNFSWFPRLRRQLAATPPDRRPFVMSWQTEPLPLPSTAPFDSPPLQLRELGKILLGDRRATDIFTNYFCLRDLAKLGLPDLLMVSTPSRREFLAEKGIRAHWVPFGYRSGFGKDLGIARDIDVLFLGTPDDARHRRSVRYLKRRGVNVIAKGSWRDPTCWGEHRTKLINRAKIFLGLQRRPGKLSGVRMILGMANKSLVVAEPIYDSAPYVPGRHYISAALDEMPDVIDFYLRNDAEREKIVDEAHRFVTEELTMERSLARMIELLEQHR